jgi:hypothetical protein
MRRFTAIVLLSAALAACGGGGGGGSGAATATAAVAAPAGLALDHGIKSFAFSWSPVPGATAYQVLEDPDGAGPLPAVPVGGQVAGTSTSVQVFLPERLNASYQVRACTADGCGAPSAAVRPDVNRAIGYFKASNAAANGAFGASVALSADGTTLAVGATGDDSGATGVDGDPNNSSTFQAGAVYVYVRDGGTWRQQAYVKASNTGLNDNFGSSVALSSDGNTLAVSAPGEAGGIGGINGAEGDDSAPRAGAVYVFTRSGSTWTQQAYVKASNPGADDNFGFSLALSADGQTMAVGAGFEDSAATGVNGNQADESAANSGAAYVYTRSGATWTQQAYVKASNTGAGDFFGASLKLSADGNTLAVSAPNESSASPGIDGNQADNSLLRAGAAYVYTRSGTSWTQQAYIKASNPGQADSFGESIALSADGNTLVVSTINEDSGAVGQAGNQADNSVSNNGAVYVFTRAGAVWSQQAYLKPSRALAGQLFGIAVALSGDGNILAVGAYGEPSGVAGIGRTRTDSNAPSAGAVYAFRRSGSTWTETSVLKATNPRANAEMGYGLALSADGRTLAAGSIAESSAAAGIGGNAADTSAPRAGAVYVY